MPDKRQAARSQRRWAAEDEETAAFIATLLRKGDTINIGEEVQFSHSRDGQIANVRRLITPALVKRANELIAEQRALEKHEDHGIEEGAPRHDN